MTYVNTIVDIFNNSEESDSQLNETYFKNQQESMEKACHKIMKVLPYACQDSRRFVCSTGQKKKIHDNAVELNSSSNE